ncbi:hypothetical protein LDB17_12380 [Dysgonomonas sp. Shenzhen-Wh21]|uniref:DUF7017 domain-containing protein n=1 Tax=Dysgonomonas TaxID=156973 RepID=UPI00208FBF7D|nr:hypothetical protein [Dysgonomonas mossii]
MSFKEVTELRKAGRLNDALKLAQEDLRIEQNEWSFSALFWVLNDMCKDAIAKNTLEVSNRILIDIEKVFDKLDDYEGFAAKAIDSLKKKLDPNLDILQKATTLNKEGKYTQALKIYQDLYKQKKLNVVHHESYGWTIYSYVTKNFSNLNSLEIRTLLRDYMILENSRPSRLHTLFLNFAMKVSEQFPDFKLLPFVKMFGINNLSREDYYTSNIEGKSIKPFIERLLQRLSMNIEFSITEILEVFEISTLEKEDILDYLREPYFWKIYKEKDDKQNLWTLLKEYTERFRNQQSSNFHSKILNHVLWNTNDEDSQNFYSFILSWGINNFRREDWIPIRKDDTEYDSIALKCINRLYTVIEKMDTKVEPHILSLFEDAVSIYSDNNSLKRKYAIILMNNGEKEKARIIYKNLLVLMNEWYIWFEFFKIQTEIDNSLKLALLSKVLLMQSNTDFTGEVRLYLAEVLIEMNLMDNSAIELDLYEKNRIKNGWKLSNKYFSLKNHVSSITIKENKSNKIIYEKYVSIAEEYAYEQIPSIEMVLVAKFKNKEGKDRLKLVDSNNSIEIVLSPKKHRLSPNEVEGEIYSVKLYKTGANNSYIPLHIKKTEKSRWSILSKKHGYIEYININKNILHIITGDSIQIFYQYKEKEKFNVGEFVCFNQLIESFTSNNEKKINIKNLLSCDMNDAIKEFPHIIAVIDDINQKKKVLHYVAGKKPLTGIIKLDDINFTPQIGDFISLHYYICRDKEGTKRIKTLTIEETSEERKDLVRIIEGQLLLKYRSKFYDYNEEDCGETEPDFGFISDYYVPKFVLQKHNIKIDCRISAKIIFDGEKWKVFDIINF